MGTGIFINILVTIACVTIIGIYFNRRERRLQGLAETKLLGFKDQYLHHVARRKVKEKLEIEKLKIIASQLEEKHRHILEAARANTGHKGYDEEVNKMLKIAEEKAKQIEEEMKSNAEKFVQEQQKEVQMKMVDLVIGVTKKVIGKTITPEEHKAYIEEALKEMEGEDEE